MTERYRRSSGLGDTYVNPAKMENEFTPKKTMIIMVIVVACFAVLWPKIFYPMLVGSANQQIKPSAIDKTTGCCYVLSETDVDTIKIMSELCGDIIKRQVGDMPSTGRQIINICQDEVFRTCGIDVSLVSQEQVRSGHTTKQISDEIRSLNGSLCFKYNFGVQPWRSGVPHMLTLKNVSESVRQERSPLVRSEMVHPAFRERGRAIPQSKVSHPHPKIIDGTPGPLPGMRPTMGGPGHMVPPPKQQGSGSMGIIMPIYTIGIVIFFTYTLMKIICKKHPDTDTIYSKMEVDPRFRKEALAENGSRGPRDAGSCKLVVNAMSALLEEVDSEMEARRKSSEVEQDECLNSANLSNGSVKKDDKPSVKIMAMETSESCEDGKKWQSANSSVLPTAPQPVSEKVEPPKEIFLERALPAQSQISVADSATETEKNANDDDSAVVLAGKMTLSVISLENEQLEIGDILKVNSNETEEIIESKPVIEEEINHIIEKAIESLGNGKSENTTNGSPETDSQMEEMEQVNDKDLAKGEIKVQYKKSDEEIQKKTVEFKENNVPKEETNVDSNGKREEGQKTTITETKSDAEEISPIFTENEQNCDKTSDPPSLQTSGVASSPMLNLNAKSSSEDSGSTVLSDSNQGSVINVSTREVGDEEEEEVEVEEVSEEESEYEEEEIEVTDEDEIENNETERESRVPEMQNAGAGLVNGAVSQNGNDEDEESEEEEIIEEIIEEYSDEEEVLENNSN